MSFPFDPGFLSQLSADTRRDIQPTVWDNYFKDDPFALKLKRERMKPWRGGLTIQENFIYDSLPVQSMSALGGSTFPQVTYQLDTGGTFNIKQKGVNITLPLEQIRGINRGELAPFKIIDVQTVDAGLALSASLAISFYQGGQGARVLEPNGLAEQLSDGTNASFDTTTYTTYGTIARNGTIGAALNSPMTVPASNVNGPLSYKLLEEGYSSCIVGSEQPDLIVTTNLAFSYMKQKFFPQWRTETQDPKVGFNSIVFNKAMIMPSQYCPGTRGVNDAKIGNYYLSTGETLFMINTKTLTLHVSDDDLFGFGFTGWKPAQDNLAIAGQHLFQGNLTNRSPRLSRQFFGILA